MGETATDGTSTGQSTATDAADVVHSLSPDSLDTEAASNAQEAAREQATSPNARSKSIQVADGADTHGGLNVLPASSANAPFRVGVSEDRNKKCRRSMEDAHAFVHDFAGVSGQGYFAVFDGHAGKSAAEWCGMNFHEYLLRELEAKPNESIPDLLNSTFHTVDAKLSELAAADGTHSGCTAVTAFLRLEDANGKGLPKDMHQQEEQHPETPTSPDSAKRKMFGDGVHREKLKSLVTGSKKSSTSSSEASHVTAAKRTLYTANVGDARAVLSRGGRAVRLTYDHKGSDPQEAKRVTDAGGFVMNNRVNGVLAVTRSLGDSSMKSCIVGSPYTTETTLGDEDDFLIIACDGLWDVCEDQQSVDLIANEEDPQKASEILLEHALGNYSTDNLSILVIALRPSKRPKV